MRDRKNARRQRARNIRHQQQSFPGTKQLPEFWVWGTLGEAPESRGGQGAKEARWRGDLCGLDLIEHGVDVVLERLALGELLVDLAELWGGVRQQQRVGQNRTYRIGEGSRRLWHNLSARHFRLSYDYHLSAGSSVQGLRRTRR